MEKVIALRQDVLRSIARKALLATAFAALTAALSQISLRLPFTPVPITLQTLAVIVTGMVLGSRLGALAQIEYVALGLSGVPVFAGWKAGLGHLLGPTGGYLVGFIGGAFVAGLVVEIWRGKGDTLRHFAAGVAGAAVILLMGACWLAGWLTLFQGAGSGAWAAAWRLGIQPFVLPDVVKAGVAATVSPSARRLLTRGL